jgi:cytosine permease
MEERYSDFEASPVPPSERRGFLSMFSVWVAFQCSTVMLFFGGLTLAHLSFPQAAAVVACATAMIALVSGVTGYLGAATGKSTALLCEDIFGSRGGVLQQVFQGVIELGWFAVIVGLTGDAAAGLVGIESLPLKAGLTFACGALFTVSVFFGFRGIRLLSVFTVPVVLVLLLAIVVRFRLGTGGPLWSPSAGGVDLLQSISQATGTFITGAALSADLTRFARSPRIGFGASAASFAFSLPFTLFLGALVAMTSTAGPDFVAAVQAAGLGGLVLAFLVLGNWTSGDTTLYLCVVPLVKLTRARRRWLVVATGFLGSAVAASGTADAITTWLTTLSILLPPLAGPLMGYALHRSQGKTPLASSQGFRPGLLAWPVGVAVGLALEVGGIGLAPVSGIASSFVLYLFLTRTEPAHA